MTELRMIPYELLNEPPFPMREQFGDMPFEALVESIRASGVENPLKVRPVNGRFEIITGHRRYKAAGVCAKREVPCLVEECDDLTAVEKMVAENTGREDVSPTEEGHFYLGLIERFSLDMPALARVVRKSEAYCDARISLVQLDANIAEAVLQKAVGFGVAQELLRVNPCTAALVLRCPVGNLTPQQLEFIEVHRGRLLDLCVQSGATQRLAHSYVDQWKRSLMPMNPYPAQTDAAGQAAQTVVRMPRCLVCGRDADPQNMVELKVHYYEVDKVKQVLREAGFTLYE